MQIYDTYKNIRKVIQETRGVMIYKYEEMKEMISLKNEMGNVTVLSESFPHLLLFVNFFDNPFAPLFLNGS